MNSQDGTLQLISTTVILGPMEFFYRKTMFLQTYPQPSLSSSIQLFEMVLSNAFPIACGDPRAVHALCQPPEFSCIILLILHQQKQQHWLPSLGVETCMGHTDAHHSKRPPVLLQLKVPCWRKLLHNEFQKNSCNVNVLLCVVVYGFALCMVLFLFLFLFSLCCCVLLWVVVCCGCF